MGSGRRTRALAAIVPVLAAVSMGVVAVADRRADAPALTDAPAIEQVVVAAGDDRPANPHAKAVGDLDGDGYPDVAAASSVVGSMRWYREKDDRSGWTVHTVRESGGWGTEMRAADIDADGDLDLITATKDALRWYENPRPTTSPLQVSSWTERTIGAEGRNTHDLALGDLNGDGRLDVVNRPKVFRLSVPVTHVWLQTADGWQHQAILQELRYKGEGLEVGDLDLDGDLDIVGSGFWVENQSGGTDWSTVHTVDPQYFHPVHENDDPTMQSHVGVAVADFTADGRLDIVMGSSERFNGYLALYEAAEPKTGGSGRWQRKTLDVGVSFVHGMRGADMDGDGDLDVVTAEAHQTTTQHGRPSRVLVYRNPAGTTSSVWAPHVVSTVGSHNIQTADFDADGDVDFAGANWGTDGTGGPAAPDGAKIYLWRNLLVDGPRPSTTTTTSDETTTTTTDASTTSSTVESTSTTAAPTSTSTTSSSTSTTSSSTSTTSTTVATTNLAPNPGFEANPTTHYITHGTGTFTWASDQAFSGTRSVKIVSNQASTALARWMSRTNLIEAQPGALYRASAYMRVTSVSNKAVLSIQFWNENLQHLGGVESLRLNSTNPWRLLTVERVAPAGTRYVRIEFRLYGPGTMWADDASLVKV